MRVGSVDFCFRGCDVEARPAGPEVATGPAPPPTCGKDHRGRRRAGLLPRVSPLRLRRLEPALGGSVMRNFFALVFTALVLLAGGAAVGMAVTISAAATCEACGGVYAND